jgi:photoactive yellow protein
MTFDHPDLLALLERSDMAALDALPFGVIGLDRSSVVSRYNATEARAAGFSPEQVIGRRFFADVAPCMNNYLVALRFEAEDVLDVVMDYVFTLRMAPTPVRLRLLKDASVVTSYVVVLRAAAA